VLCEVPWSLGRGMPAEIRRRGNDGHAYLRPDRHGDHVLSDLLAQSHSRVVALRDNVGQAVVDNHFDMDVGIARHKLLLMPSIAAAAMSPSCTFQNSESGATRTSHFPI
jgi:hypothetical protein